MNAKCCVHTRVHMKARHSGHQASSSVALHLIFRDRVSLWTWSLPILLNRLNHELQGSTYLPFHRALQGCTQLCSPNAADTDVCSTFLTWVARIRTHVLIGCTGHFAN